MMKEYEKTITLNIIEADKGKMLVTKDEYEQYNSSEEEIQLIGSNQIYLSESDSVDNYIEIDIPIIENIEEE